ncbi:trigger factor [Dehalococcoides mccartyi]|uniref:Trigger factor n=1 Tax=Dehalococcoides mccartyi (strain ATCC BAA-2266 / KCTC 15142 / 195) TaxID=243164 RepID=TIG_DEHM1|nr:trigger factor [Dehalococcoides mccartyi]Q3Z8J9.1 RecName: Full=Trigger factor; Short=TF; AltName: Full=PPIase [Dehalococcoides mccartyi 195]AAW39988.1 trigger factor [Dehalococcoides mccartyi 195]
MKVTDKKIEGCQASITVEMDPAEVEAGLSKTYRRLVKKVEIPGFRKGKTPRDVFEKYLGREKMLDEVVDDIVPEACQQAINDDEEIKPFAAPKIAMVTTEPFVFSARIPLPPVVELGDYKTIRAAKEKVEITEENIDTVIDQVLHQRATWEKAERPVKMGDMLLMKVESTLNGEPYLNREDMQYSVREEAIYPAPGFGEHLVDMVVGEPKEFSIVFPEDHARAELAGKTAAFKVTIQEIREEKLPELNDAFAHELNPEFNTLAELRQRIRENMQERQDDQAQAKFEDQIVEALIKMSKIDYPEVMVETELDQIIEQQLQRLQSTIKSPEEFRATLSQLSPADMQQRYRPLAEQRVASSLALGKLATTENLIPSDEEVDAEIERLTQDSGDKKEEEKAFYNKPDTRDRLIQLLTARKTMAFIDEIALQPALEAVEPKSDEGEKTEEADK